MEWNAIVLFAALWLLGVRLLFWFFRVAKRRSGNPKVIDCFPNRVKW